MGRAKVYSTVCLQTILFFYEKIITRYFFCLPVATFSFLGEDRGVEVLRSHFWPHISIQSVKMEDYFLRTDPMEAENSGKPPGDKFSTINGKLSKSQISKG